MLSFCIYQEKCYRVNDGSQKNEIISITTIDMPKQKRKKFLDAETKFAHAARFGTARAAPRSGGNDVTECDAKMRLHIRKKS